MEPIDFKENWPIPEEYMVELGRITCLYGGLENVVNVSINKLVGYSEAYDFRSAIMLAHSNFQQRVDILSTLLEWMANEYPNLKGYEDVIKLIKRAQKGRNKFIHCSLNYNPEKNIVEFAAMSARGTLKTKLETIYINELKNVSSVIHMATCELYKLIIRH